MFKTKKPTTKKEIKERVGIRFSYDANKVSLEKSDILDIIEGHFGELDNFEIYNDRGF